MTSKRTMPQNATRGLAFLYDFLQVPGGAEQVALNFVNFFRNARLVVGCLNEELFAEALLDSSRLTVLGKKYEHPAFQALNAIRVFTRRTGFLADFKTVVYSGSYAPLAVRSHGRGKNIYYCHTPPRFVYDLKDYYWQEAAPWQRPALAYLVNSLKGRYEESIKKMDVVLANSANVKGRLERYLGLSDVRVLHPPVDTEAFRWLSQGDYYLSTARLEPYKRVDLVIDAFSQMPDKKLVVAGAGSELGRLKKRAGNASNIAFTGWVSAAEMARLIGQCIATIYVPMDEDFGMSPVESMAAGKPVIGVAEGGLLETVTPGSTGLLIPRVTPDDGWQSAVSELVNAVNQMNSRRANEMRSDCEIRSSAYGQEAFFRGMQASIGAD